MTFLHSFTASDFADEVCPLCQNVSHRFHLDQFLLCSTCAAIFRPKSSLPSLANEKARYEEHNNDVHDEGYQQFVSPITERIFAERAPEEHGLDFGSGTGPVISKILLEAGYQIEQYDPIFKPDGFLLKSKYDYIVCCEVIEHFHQPAEVFPVLYSLLKPGGSLYCMTLLYHDGIDFANWHYQRDPTHVIIYREKTLKWIKSQYDFSSLEIDDRLIVFQNGNS